MVVIALMYDETTGFCPYESDDDGCYPDFLTGTVRSGVVLK